MHKILMNLFTGNLKPSEMKPTTCPLKQFHEKECTELEEQLCLSLSQEESALLTKLLEANNAVASYNEMGDFVNGFRLGALMMIDVFRDDDSLLHDKEQYLRHLTDPSKQ